MNKRIETAIKRYDRAQGSKYGFWFPRKKTSPGVLTSVPARDTMQAEVRK